MAEDLPRARLWRTPDPYSVYPPVRRCYSLQKLRSRFARLGDRDSCEPVGEGGDLGSSGSEWIDPPTSILIVDDDESIRALLSAALAGECEVLVTAGSAAEARNELDRRAFDLVITDISMSDEDGIALMQWARKRHPGACWMVLTGHATVDVAVKALQLGAFDFLTKPLGSMTGLRNSVRNAIDHRRLVLERDRLHDELQKTNRQLREHVDQLEAACQLLSDQADTIRADLRRAALIQQALLPSGAPLLPGFSVNSLYRPSQHVGGDLYDVVRLDDRHVVVLIADAAGHGLSAAMLAVLFRNRLSLVDQDTREPFRPCDALRAVNRTLADGLTAPGLFITAVYVLLDTATGRVSMASAGHTPVFVRRAGGQIDSMLHTGPALGLYHDADYAQLEFEIKQGDRLLLHTDGLYDRFYPDNRSSEEQVCAAFVGTEVGGEDLLGQLAGAKLTSGEGAGDQQDDVTLVVLDRVDGTSRFDNGAPIQPPAFPATLSSRELDLLVGDDGGRKILCVRGRGDWTHSAAFHAQCVASIENRCAVMVDLTLCHHLDSTFLGTIHELCLRAELADVEFRIQGVMPPVESLFTELGMRVVMDHMVPAVLPLPTDMLPLIGSPLDERSQALHLLRAHQGLAQISEQNLREFDPLLEALRNEVATLDPPETV